MTVEYFCLALAGLRIAISYTELLLSHAVQAVRVR